MAFDFLKKTASGLFNKYSGNKDFIEAVCAASALVAAADGTISDDEIETIVTTIGNNPKLLAAYSNSEIEEQARKQLRKASSISGRVGLKRELEDVAGKDIEIREDVFAAALDVANADGDIGQKERAALQNIASILRVNPGPLMNAA